MVKWIHQTGFWTKDFCETQNAECLWKVNQFSEWIQVFWTFFNQNSAFSHSSNMHHILEFCTSCWYSVAKWLWKKPHVLWRKRCRYRFSLLCCQFPRQYRRFRHKRVWSFSHNINHIIYFSPTFFSQNIVQNPQIRLRETETKHLKRLTFFPTIIFVSQDLPFVLKARIF